MPALPEPRLEVLKIGDYAAGDEKEQIVPIAPLYPGLPGTAEAGVELARKKAWRRYHPHRDGEGLKEAPALAQDARGRLGVDLQLHLDQTISDGPPGDALGRLDANEVDFGVRLDESGVDGALVLGLHLNRKA